MTTYYNHETHNVESDGTSANTGDIIKWHAWKPEPELFDKDNSDNQVSGVWSAVFLPEGTDDYFTDGPFIMVDAYIEVMEYQSRETGVGETEYGITTQIEYGSRENGDVTTSEIEYEYGALAVYDVEAGFRKCKGIIEDYIRNVNRNFSWDGKSVL